MIKISNSKSIFFGSIDSFKKETSQFQSGNIILEELLKANKVVRDENWSNMKYQRK